MSNLIPSIASANLLQLENEIKYAEQKSTNIHIDIEDGNFVLNITFGMKTIEAIRSCTNLPFSMHLMTKQIDAYINRCHTLNCSHIFIHVENQMCLSKYLHQIREMKIKAGIALNPISNIMNYEYLFDEIDAILYMTSEPDEAGDHFRKEVLNKVKIVKNKEIWIDGGVTLDKVAMLEKIGVTHIVMGRAFFNGDTNE